MHMFGPNMHAISFSYCLTFFAIFSLYRAKFAQAGLFLFLVVLCSAKGPLLLFLMIGLSWTIFKLFGPRMAFWFHCILVTLYTLAGIYAGLNMGDFHILGLMAGLNEFIYNPIGYGIGAGGVYSPDFAKIDWYAAQGAGRTPFPVESSIGVLLYQVGMAAGLIVAFYGWLSWKMMKLAQTTANSLHIAASLALISMIANGFFQEEAFFSPLSLALYLGLTGTILGAAKRERFRPEMATG
jgi:hypothetical protein